VAVALAWVGIEAFGPLGITTRGSTSRSLFYEVAFMSLLDGSVFGVDALGRQEWLFAPLGLIRRILAEWLVVFTAGLAFLIAGLLPALWLGVWSPGQGSTTLAGTCGVLLATQVHLAAAVTLIQRLPLAPPAPALLLPLLVWVLPAVLTTRGALGNRLAWLFASRRPLSPEDGAFESLLGAALDPRPACFLLLLAVLLTRRAVLHALRNSG
jgi:hypothetical protein